MVDLALIILNYKTKDLLESCLKSIYDKKWSKSIEIWVVDNASEDGSVEMVKKKFDRAHLIESDKNLGFSGGNNLALQKAEAKNYLLLNSDTEITDGSLDILVGFIEKSGFDVVSCQLINRDGSFQPNAGDLPFGMSLIVWLFGIDDFLPFLKDKLPSFHQTAAKYYSQNREVGWVSGSAIMFKKQVLDKIGLWDNKIFMYGEDVDYCYRAKKAGFKIGWTNKAVIKHVSGASSHDPHMQQWLGEFHGLLYLYQKYFGTLARYYLKLLIYKSTLLRMIAFFIIGKTKFSRTYSKILFNL